jgi:hypothetical protein
VRVPPFFNLRFSFFVAMKSGGCVHVIAVPFVKTEDALPKPLPISSISGIAIKGDVSFLGLQFLYVRAETN